MRLAFARINQETNCLSPYRTTFADFTGAHYLEGDTLLSACALNRPEADGFMKNAELSGFVEGAQKHAELVAILSAWAVPSGPLTRECFDTLTDKLTAGIKAALPLDGIYLCLHGAMGVDGILGPEAEIVRRVRAVVGPDLPIAVTFDLHGNITQDLVAQTPLILAYHTNPHRDHRKVGRRAAALLVATVQGKIKPVAAWRSLPMLLGGGTTVDILQPMRGIFARMRQMEKDGALYTSVLTCHPWNSHPALGWSVVVVTDNNQALAEKYADLLADLCWAAKDQLPPKFPGPEDAVAAAKSAWLARKLGAVVISDASDVVTAGAYGENTALIKALVEGAPELVTYSCIRDPQVVEKLWNDHQVGDTVTVTLGGKMDPAYALPYTVTGRLTHRPQSHGVGKMAVLKLGEHHLLIVEGPCLAIRPAFYENAGLPIWRAQVVMVKNFFPFRLFFLPYARKTIYVRTAGVTDFDAAFKLTFDGPMHPREPVADWRPRDLLRRGL